MAVIWVVFGLLAAYLIYGAVARSRYRRVFPAALGPDRVEAGFLCPQEVLDPDETEMTDRVSGAVANDTFRKTANAGRDDPLFHEPHWGHTGAILTGTLRIDGTGNLPEPFRVGLFATQATYPIVARSGVAKDPDLGFAVHRLGLKLRYSSPVPNAYAPDGDAEELDLLLVAGEPRENGEGHAFFARDGRQLDMATSLKPLSLRTVRVVANWRNLAMLTAVLATIRRFMKPARQAPTSTSGWAGKPYFSLGPYALGPGAMKFNLTPRQDHPVDHTDPMKSDLAAVNTAQMEAWLDRGENAEFTLGIQLATPGCIPEPGPGDPPKSVMAAEYCDLLWDETRSPYVPVGTLTLSPDRRINTAEIWGALQFNAWNTLPEMRPLGQLFRMRRQVHAAHSAARVSHLFGAKHGAMTGKCPFSG